jgi:hypothetical protein
VTLNGLFINRMAPRILIELLVRESNRPDQGVNNFARLNCLLQIFAAFANPLRRSDWCSTLDLRQYDGTPSFQSWMTMLQATQEIVS